MKGFIGRLAAAAALLVSRSKGPPVVSAAEFPEVTTTVGEYKLRGTPAERFRSPPRKPRKRLGIARGPHSIRLYDACVLLWLKTGKFGPRPPRENTHQWLKKQQAALLANARLASPDEFQTRKV